MQLTDSDIDTHIQSCPLPKVLKRAYLERVVDINDLLP